jgi:hypothetical protein
VKAGSPSSTISRKTRRPLSPTSSSAIQQSTAINLEFKSFHASLKFQSQRHPGVVIPTDIMVNKQQAPNAPNQQNSGKSKFIFKGTRRKSSVVSTGKPSLQKHRSKEETFTDKDRAAAVALGSRDIKMSLNKKKQMDGLYNYHHDIPEDTGFVICFTQGEHNYRNGDYKLALHFLDKVI